MYSWIGKRQNGTTVSWSSIAARAEDTVIDAEAARIAAMSVPVFLNLQNELHTGRRKQRDNVTQ
jgi:hypothetical protein